MAADKMPDPTVFFYGSIPRLPLSLSIVRRNGTIVAIVFSLILLLTTGRAAPLWTVSWILVYGLGRTFRRRAVTVPWLRKGYELHLVQQATALSIVALATLFVWYIYHHTPYLASQRDDKLWLLFVLTPLATAQLGHWLLLAVASIAAAFALSATMPGIHPTFPYWLEVPVTRALWILLLSLAIHTLLRIAGDRSARLRLLHGILGRVTGLRTSTSRLDTLAALVSSVAEAFEYDHVAVYLVEPDQSIKLVVAGPSPVHDVSAEKRRTDNHGIPEHVAVTRNRYVANNTASDDIYRSHGLFPDAASELAVPIFQGDTVVGVLDVRSRRPNTFIDQDAEACEMLAARIATILDNYSLFQSRQRLSDISASLTERFSRDSVSHTLRDVATAALEELRADVVMLYEHDPSSDGVRFAVCAGTLHAPTAINMTGGRRASLVEERLAGKEFVFEEVVDGLSDSFAGREAIRSRASVHLIVDQQLLGLMFLNYRHRHAFDKDEQEAVRRFARFAALALERRQIAKHLLERQRDEFVATLHDSIASKLTGAEWHLTLGREGGESGRRHLDVAALTLRNISEDVKQIVRVHDNSDSSLAENTLTSFAEELSALHSVNVRVRQPVPSLRWTALEAMHIKAIVGEAAFNAAKAGASTVSLAFGESQGECHVTVSDDGPGFDTASIRRGSGLANMEKRATWLGGTCSVQSTRHGTVVQLSFPHQEASGR